MLPARKASKAVMSFPVGWVGEEVASLRDEGEL